MCGIAGQIHINKSLEQNHFLYERKPNGYDPDTVMWLNLYKF